MKKFNLKPHEAAYVRLIISTFAGLDYATANSIENAKARRDKMFLKTIREIQIHSCEGLVSEYCRACLIAEKLLPNDPTLLCAFDPRDTNTENTVEVYSADEINGLRAENAEKP